MKVFVISYDGEDPDAIGPCAVCDTQKLAIERAEGLAQEMFDEEPELSMEGWYMDTGPNRFGEMRVAIYNKLNVPSDVWTIFELEVESDA